MNKDPATVGNALAGAPRALAEAVDLFQAGLSQCRRPEDRILVERFLAELAPLLAALVLGRSIPGRIGSIERLIGNSWLVDEAPFELALAKWREFRTQYEQSADKSHPRGE
ncbi:MAG: hypothetical protein J0M16_00905 [Gammaproteobacteria bacterium]|nr:hypothetical protein [Gammaproteobacteria bacterium]